MAWIVPILFFIIIIIFSLSGKKETLVVRPVPQ